MVISSRYKDNQVNFLKFQCFFFVFLIVGIYMRLVAKMVYPV